MDKISNSYQRYLTDLMRMHVSPKLLRPLLTPNKPKYVSNKKQNIEVLDDFGTSYTPPNIQSPGDNSSCWIRPIQDPIQINLNATQEMYDMNVCANSVDFSSNPTIMEPYDTTDMELSVTTNSDRQEETIVMDCNHSDIVNNAQTNVLIDLEVDKINSSVTPTIDTVDYDTDVHTTTYMDFDSYATHHYVRQLSPTFETPLNVKLTKDEATSRNPMNYAILNSPPLQKVIITNISSVKPTEKLNISKWISKFIPSENMMNRAFFPTKNKNNI